MRSVADHIAELFFLTSPEADDYIVNLQTEEGFQRVRINRDQLAGIVLEGVRILLAVQQERKQ